MAEIDVVAAAAGNDDEDDGAEAANTRSFMIIWRETKGEKASVKARALKQ